MMTSTPQAVATRTTRRPARNAAAFSGPSRRRPRSLSLCSSGGGRADVRSDGFTLFEMLFALALVMLLLGAIVFNFSALAEGVDLDEGSRRMKTALMLARAHAAHTQRPVRLAFELDETDTFTDRVYRIRLLEKPPNADEDDAAGGGGGADTGGGLFGGGSTSEGEQGGADVLVDGYRQIASLRGPQAQVNELVVVRQVRPLDRNGQVIEQDAEQAMPENPPAIEFYPDGSSESARITLLSRDVLDDRRVRVEIIGLTGRITSNVLRDEEALEEADAAEAQNENPDAADPADDSSLDYLIER